MLKIAICDDDSGCIKKYSAQLKKLAKKHKIEIQISTYASGESLLFEWANGSKQADALYLDIYMEGIDGIKTARELRKMGCTREIVFITKARKPVYQAFDVSAFHYIVKDGENSERFEEIFLQLTEKIERKKREYISFSFGGENRDIPIEEIRYFRVDARVVTVYYGKNESFEFYSRLGNLEKVLGAKGFMRIHRSIVANVAYITRATYEEVIMQDGTRLPLGRSHLQTLKEVLEYGEDESEK